MRQPGGPSTVRAPVTDPAKLASRPHAPAARVSRIGAKSATARPVDKEKGGGAGL